MSQRIVFRSVGNPEVAYTWHESYYELRDQLRGDHLSANAGFFLTYGDELCQHSGESIVQKDNMGDYLLSLASHLMEYPDNVRVVSGSWPRSDGGDKAQFACTIRYKEGKRTYYSWIDRKVSGSDSKRHDKRWEEVPTWADGSFDSVFRLACGNYRDAIERYVIADTCKEEVKRSGGWADYNAAEKAIGVSYEDVRLPFTVVDNLVRAFRLTEDAKRYLSAHLANLEHRKQQAEKAQEEAVPV